MELAFEFTAESSAKEIRLLEQENEKKQHKRRVEELQRRPHQHPIIWKAMRHQDREEFAGFSEVVDSQGVVPLSTLTE
jgi:transcriptional regulator of NAD metabolism